MRGEPKGESGGALGGHGKNSGVGPAGSVASRAAREDEGARGLGRQNVGGGVEGEIEKYVIGLRVRSRAAGDGGGVGDKSSRSTAVGGLGSEVVSVRSRRRKVRAGRKRASAEG